MSAIDIPAEQWNAMVRRIERAWPIAGMNCRASEIEGGVVLDAVPKEETTHPWLTRVAWELDPATQKGEWRARVLPGFCNGRDVRVSVKLPENEAATDLVLTADPAPWLVLDRWRVAGDGEMPAFIQRLNPYSVIEYRTAAGVESGRERQRVRPLRAMDIVLVQPRAGMKLVAEPGSTELGDPAAVIQPAYSSFRDEAARLVALQRFEPVGSESADTISSLYSIMLQGADEDADRLKVATVWVLGPLDAEPDEQPNETWTPFVQHFLFWNVWWAPQNPPKAINPGEEPATLLLPLAALGAGTLLSQILFAISQSATVEELARAFFQTIDIRGKFWTT